MKKFLLFSSIFLLGITGKAQEVFPASDAIWNVNTIEDKSFLYALMGDTVIDDTIYHQIYCLKDSILSPEYRLNYIGALREQNRKVWVRIPGWKKDTEFLLYDFSKKVGEKIYFSPVYFQIHDFGGIGCNPNDTVEAIVEKISEDSSGRKHYFIHYPGLYKDEPEEWIEGIGTVTGLSYFRKMIPTGPSHAYYDETYLQCFKHQGKIEYRHNESWSGCQTCFCKQQFYVDITEEKKGTVSLYPNPAHREIGVELPAEIQQAEISIYLMNGSMADTRLLSSQHTTIGVTHLAPGTYVYRISAAGIPVQTGKIIICH